jgi:hypothetical protein
LKKGIQHFSNDVWADFVRGADTAGTAQQIESHLAEGCAGCVASLDLWSRLLSAAVNEKTYAPPEQLVRRLKLEFTTRYSPQTSGFRVADLVFDSLSSALQAGLRSGANTGARQLVFEGEGLTVDLRVETASHSKKVCAVGQVLCKASSPTSPSEGTVVLWTMQGYPIVKTNPNEHGEFQLEFRPEDRLHLSITMPGRIPVRFPLPELNVTSSVCHER